MIEHQQSFFSDGVRLAGTFYFPDTVEPGRPVLLFCSGFMGLKRIHPERFARFFVPRGYPCFGFDYRGFGDSDGAPGAVLVEEQVRDIANAVACVRAEPRLAGRKLVLGGWGMGGGLVLEAARLVTVDALICVNGFYDAVRVQRRLRGEPGWQAFLAKLAAMRGEASRSGVVPQVDPFDIYPLDAVTQTYVDDVLRRVPGFGGSVHLGFADSLLSFAPQGKLAALEQIPLLIAHGDGNALHPPEEAERLHAAYPGTKELYWLAGAGHTEWMLDDHPLFKRLAERLAAWVGTVA